MGGLDKLEERCALGLVCEVVKGAADHEKGFGTPIEMDVDLFDFPEVLFACEQGAKARPCKLLLREISSQKRTPQPEKKYEKAQNRGGSGDKGEQGVPKLLSLLDAVGQEEFDFVVAGESSIGSGRGWSGCKGGLEGGLECLSKDFFGFGFAVGFEIKVEKLGRGDFFVDQPEDIGVSIVVCWFLGWTGVGGHGGKGIDR